MFNPLDFLRGGAAGLEPWARQFGLSQEEMMRAVAALTPAFLMGLQRQATNPATLATLWKSWAAPQPQTFDDPVQALAQAQQQGAQALAQIFGGPDLSRRIADAAAAWSGVSAQALQQIMPVIAAAMMKGAAEQASGFFPGAAQGQAPGSRPEGPYAAWAEMMQRMIAPGTPGAADRKSPQQEPSMAAAAEAWAEMLRAMTGQAPEAAGKSAPPPAEPEKKAAAAGWEQALATGRQAQEQYVEQYLATLQNIFDQVWGASPGRR